MENQEGKLDACKGHACRLSSRDFFRITNEVKINTKQTPEKNKYHLVINQG